MCLNCSALVPELVGFAPSVHARDGCSATGLMLRGLIYLVFFFQAEDGIRDKLVTGVQTCALPIYDLQVVLNEKALLIGHSLGARNALVAGLRFPGRVAAVVAIDFTPYIEPEVFDALEERVAGGEQNFASMKGIQTYLAGRYPRLPADAVARRAQYGYENVDGKWRPLAVPQAMRETCMGLREDLTDVLKNIRVPVLLMRGVDSRLVSREAWAKTRALRPDLPAVEIAGADHYVPEERPREVAAAGQEFWGSIARRKA